MKKVQGTKSGSQYTKIVIFTLDCRTNQPHADAGKLPQLRQKNKTSGRVEDRKHLCYLKLNIFK